MTVALEARKATPCSEMNGGPSQLAVVLPQSGRFVGFNPPSEESFTTGENSLDRDVVQIGFPGVLARLVRCPRLAGSHSLVLF